MQLKIISYFRLACLIRKLKNRFILAYFEVEE